MRLKALLHNIVSVEGKDCEIKGLNEDSRCIRPQDLFLAYPGTQKDGRDYILDAISKGAAAVLMEAGSFAISLLHTTTSIILVKKDLKNYVSEIAARFYGYPAKGMLLIGVTGTNGKSSCTHFIAASLAQAGRPCGIIGGVGCGIYQPSFEGASLITLQASRLTTPSAIELQRLLAAFKAEKVVIAVLEVSSHALSQGRIDHLPIAIAGFTNLTHEHLDYHGTLEAYAETKKKLFMLPQLKYAVFNRDDAYGLKWEKAFFKSKLSVYSYTINPLLSAHSPLNSVKASIIKADLDQLAAHITTPWGEGLLKTHHLIGSFNISNLLLVLTILSILKIPLNKSLEYIKQLKPVPGRMGKLLQPTSKPLVIVDYAHTPDALQSALKALKPLKGKLWCVFGCGGNRDKTKRPLMGRIAEQYADRVIVTQDNSRNEKAEVIIKAILSGTKHPQAIQVEPDRRLAITQAIQSAQCEDIILIAGKGHEHYQTRQGVHYLLTDHQVAEKVLLL